MHECEFTNDATTLVRDIFVVSIHDDHLGERLLAKDVSQLTFDMALAKAKAFECAWQDWEVAKAQSCEANNVNYGQSHILKDDSRNHCTIGAGGGRIRHSQKACYRCGSLTHKANNMLCPARNKTCQRCSKEGHYEACCRSTLKTNGSKTNMNCVQQTTDCDLFACHLVFNVNESKDSFVNLDDFSHEILVNRTCKVFALVDSGSLNILPQGLVPDLSLEPLDAKIFAWGGFLIEVLGIAEVDVVYKKWVKVKFHVIAVDKIGSRVRQLMMFDLCRKLTWRVCRVVCCA